jgi:membrane protein CcdC involved in cytochrome C biogenesis
MRLITKQTAKVLLLLSSRALHKLLLMRWLVIGRSIFKTNSQRIAVAQLQGVAQIAAHALVSDWQISMQASVHSKRCSRMSVCLHGFVCAACT